jgi:hypothetical protein
MLMLVIYVECKTNLIQKTKEEEGKPSFHCSFFLEKLTIILTFTPSKIRSSHKNARSHGDWRGGEAIERTLPAQLPADGLLPPPPLVLSSPLPSAEHPSPAPLHPRGAAPAPLRLGQWM